MNRENSDQDLLHRTESQYADSSSNSNQHQEQNLIEIQKRRPQDQPQGNELNQSRRTLTPNDLIEMSKHTVADLAIIADKHKLLGNTLVQTSRPLDSTNWETWKLEFEIKLRNVRLDSLILKEWSDEAKRDDRYEQFNQLAKDNVIFNVSDYLKQFIRYESSARACYVKLTEHFEGSKVIRGWRLCKSLVKMLDNKSEELDKITFAYQSLVDQFNNLFPEVPDEFYVSLFCAVVPDHYDYLLSDVLSKSENQTIKYAEIVRLTMGAFTRMREKDNPHSSAPISNVANINDMRPNQKQQNASSKQQKKTDRKQKKVKSCEHCKTDGHSTHKCWKLLQDIMSGKVEKSQYGQLSAAGSQSNESNKAPEDRKLTIGALVTNLNDADELDPNAEYLDCGAASCVFNTPTGAVELVRQEAIVRDWENRESTVQGVGTFKYRTETGFELTFKDALYKCTAGASFISYSKLAKTKLFYMEGDDETIRFYLKATRELVFTGNLVRNGLYKLSFKAVAPDTRVCAVRISQSAPAEIRIKYWHRLLGHTNFGNIVEMSPLLNISGRPSSRLICDTCTAAKAARGAFPASNSQARQIFDLVHTDLSGTIRIANPDGFSYFLILVDDYSRYIFVYLLSRKFQVKECFRRFAKWVEVQFGRSIKNLRSDNGTEFVNSDMDSLIGGEGANHHRTVHGNPQMNSRAERVMRTVAEAARTLLRDANLSVRFWPYAILYAVMLKNIVRHDGINGEIPHCRMYGEFPRYDTLHPFGLEVFALVQSPENKFSDRAVQAIFIGYPQYVKGFYVYLIDQDKIDVTRDIYLSEEAARSRVKLITRAEWSEWKSSVEPNEEELQLLTNAMNQRENESSADHLLEAQSYEEELDFESCASQLSELSSNEIIPGDEPMANPIESNPDEAQVETSSTESTNSEPVESQSTAEPEKARRFKDVYSRDAPPADYQRGSFIMNRSEYNWFTETFPSANIYRVGPYSGGPRNQRQSIWRVNAIQPPKSFREASKGADSSLWMSEMRKEYAAQVANGTWKLVERPPNAKIFPMIWVYKYQYDSQGMQIGGKARLVVLGNRQTIELNENNYAPVVNFVSVRLLLCLAVAYGLFVHHVDCNTAFLNAEVDGDFYAYQPEGFQIRGYERLVLKLLKAQYGLRQSARRWYLHLRSILLKMGFRQLFTDSCIYLKRSSGVLLIIAVYVDDLLAISNLESELEKFKAEFGGIVKIKDYGTVSKFLGLEIAYDRISRRMEIQQREYISELLREANFDKCHPLKTPMTESDFKQLAQHKENSERTVDVEWYQRFGGNIIWLAGLSRPDLAFVAGVICSRMHNPNEFYMGVLRNVLRYLQFGKSKKLVYSASAAQLQVFADSSFEEAVSKIGMITFLCGNPISWLSKKQQRVVTSTCESEILAVLDSVNEVEYFKCLLSELGFDELVSDAVTVFNDNMSAKHTLETGGDLAKNKHFRNRVNRIIRAIDDKLVTVRYIRTEDMLADMLTKPLQRVKLDQHLSRIGLI